MAKIEIECMECWSTQYVDESNGASCASCGSKALNPISCLACGERAFLHDLDSFRECEKCQKKREAEMNAYWNAVEKYVADQNINRNTKYRYWWSNGPYDSNQRLIRPAPQTLKEGPVFGRHQLSEAMAEARHINNTNFWRSCVYLARTGEKLKYPIEDIDLVLHHV